MYTIGFARQYREINNPHLYILPIKDNDTLGTVPTLERGKTNNLEDGIIFHSKMHSYMVILP